MLNSDALVLASFCVSWLRLFGKIVVLYPSPSQNGIFIFSHRVRFVPNVRPELRIIVKITNKHLLSCRLIFSVTARHKNTNDTNVTWPEDRLITEPGDWPNAL